MEEPKNPTFKKVHASTIVKKDAHHVPVKHNFSFSFIIPSFTGMMKEILCWTNDTVIKKLDRITHPILNSLQLNYVNTLGCIYLMVFISLHVLRSNSKANIKTQFTPMTLLPDLSKNIEVRHRHFKCFFAYQNPVIKTPSRKTFSK